MEESAARGSRRPLAGAAWEVPSSAYRSAPVHSTQEDPIGLAGGLNLYGYGAGDPVNNADPFGLDCRVAETGAPCPKSAAVAAVERVGSSLVRFAQNIVAGMAAAGSPHGGSAANDGPGFTTGVALHFVLLGGAARAPAVGTAATAADMLMPGGSPLGTAGSSGVREVVGGLDDANALFSNLARGGSPVSGTSYPGQLVSLPNGGTIGLRTKMSRSPGAAATIDVNVPGVPFDKIKFNPSQP